MVRRCSWLRASARGGRVGDLYFHAGDQPKLAVGDHRFARLESAADYGIGANRPPGLHRSLFDRRIGLDDVYKIPILPVLYRLGRHHGCVFVLSETQQHRRELAWPEAIVRIIERSL